jgi:subtilisin family serine protease
MFLALCVIAIIDTGVNCAGLNCLQGYNNTDDGTGHGTLVAQIAQQTAPSCHILPVKVYSQGTLGKGSSVTISGGLKWVRRWKRKNKKTSLAVNMSLSTKYGSSFLVNEIRKLDKMGVPIVVAAGNGSFNRIAKYKRTLSIGAADKDGNIEPWSNFGDLYVQGRVFGEGHAFSKGTSYAAPVVSAILAYTGGMK